MYYTRTVRTSRMCALCVTRSAYIVRSLEQWRTTAGIDPMNKDQNVCTAIVPSLIAKSGVKRDYGLCRALYGIGPPSGETFRAAR